MGFAKLVFGPFEKAIQARALAQRKFWSTPSNIPIYIRKRGDGFFFALTILGIGYQAIFLPERIKKLCIE